jgi:hypothetical protein
VILLGFFVLKPIIAERLKKPAAALARDAHAVPAEWGWR